MTRKTKILILIVSFVFLGWFIFQPLSDLGISRPYASPPISGQKIDVAELNEFLNLWTRIVNGPLQKYLVQISLSSKQQYPTAISNWLKAQHWSVERFFYDEQRIRGLVDCVSLQESLESNIALSKRQNNLRPIVKEQRQRLSLCRYDKDEMELIRANLYQITEILAGRAVMSQSDSDKE